MKQYRYYKFIVMLLCFHGVLYSMEHAHAFVPPILSQLGLTQEDMQGALSVGLSDGSFIRAIPVDTQVFVIKQDAGGSLRRGFGIQGMKIINFQASSLQMGSLELVENGNKILVTFQTYGADGVPRNNVEVRLNANGSNDQTFGVDGIRTTPVVQIP
jgi:hypothetical protein